jgi:hypothetical protein
LPGACQGQAQKLIAVQRTRLAVARQLVWCFYSGRAEPVGLSRPGLRVDSERYPAALRSLKRAGALMATGVALLPDRIWKRQRLLGHAFACLAVFSYRGAALRGRSFCAHRWQAPLPNLIIILQIPTCQLHSIYSDVRFTIVFCAFVSHIPHLISHIPQFPNPQSAIRNPQSP